MSLRDEARQERELRRGFLFDVLQEVETERERLDRMELDAIRELRSMNVSWGDIGEFYGISRQAMRFKWNTRGVL